MSSEKLIVPDIKHTNGSFDKATLPDVHAIVDTRGVGINRVGVEDVKHPIRILRKDGGHIEVLGRFNMFGSLSSKLKGINMSRPAEVLALYTKDAVLSGKEFPTFLQSLASRLETNDVYVSAAFDYWMYKTTPISGLTSPSGYECKFIGQMVRGALNFVVEVNVPIATYCPCSKEMCLVDKENGLGKGAHAQRGIVTLQVVTNSITPGVWLEDLIRIAELSGSAELYTLLKRPDEKFVTIQGYENPKFVEDVAREIAGRVHQLPEAAWFKVRVRNLESIHAHNATAYVGQGKKDGVWSFDNRSFY